MSATLPADFLDRLDAVVGQRNARPLSNGEVRFTCPESQMHKNGDAHPSARWNREKATWFCDVCGVGDGAVDLARRLDVPLPERANARRQGCQGIPPELRAHLHAPPGAGCKLAAYAAAKRLPEAFLRDLGLRDMPYLSQPAVLIPYRDAAGQELARRFRLGLAKGAEGDDRFRWRSGDKPLPYGLERVDRAREAGHVVLVEGESDCHTLWYHDVPALGLPGASTWKNQWADCLADIPIVYLFVEPDPAGEALLKKVSQSPLRSRLRVIRLADAKDPSDLYLSHPEDFSTRWQAAMVTAVAFEDEAAQARVAAAKAAWEKCAELAQAPRILDAFERDLHRLGAVGEERAAKLIFLAVISRFLDRPVSLALKGPSAAGKSFTAGQVLRFFPSSAYYSLTAMSERALAYSDEPLVQRMLVLYEAAGMSGDVASYLVRSLLSEGCLRYETVEKTEDGLKGRLIERPGPTGLIVTTTALKLHPENETRLLSVPVNDTREQTARVLRSVADDGRARKLTSPPGTRCRWSSKLASTAFPSRTP